MFVVCCCSRRAQEEGATAGKSAAHAKRQRGRLQQGRSALACTTQWTDAPAPLPPNPDLNDGIPGAIELLAKGSVHADFWDWW